MSEYINGENTNPIVKDNVRFLSDLDRVARAKQQEWANAHPDANPQTNPYSFLSGSDFKKVEFAKLMKPGIFSRTNEDIKQAVNMWCNPDTRAQAEVQYGSISDWETSRVTDMKGLFWTKRHFNDDISAWNVGNVITMNSMFADATSFNGDISAWDVGNVTDMKGMFFEARSFNQPIGGWDTSQVTDMSIMFFKARSFNQYIGGWNTLQVTDMENMFVDCPISRFNKPGCFGKMCKIVSKPINWLKGRGGAKNTRRRKYKATRRRRSQRRRVKTSTRRQRR